MENTIYTATPLLAFSGGIFLVVFMLGLGVIGLGIAIFRCKDKILGRVVTGAAGLVLLLVGCVMAILLFFSIQNGDEMVVAHLDKKRVVESNCSNSGMTCTSYQMEMTANSKYYTFGVNEDVLDKVQEGQCYQVTYYASKPLLNLQENQYADQYIGSSTITLIQRAACP